jgi:hypothetical protein
MDVPSQCTIVRAGRSGQHLGSGFEDKTHKISERSAL